MKLHVVNIAFGGRVSPVGPGDEYRVKAFEFRAMARSENDRGIRAEFQNLARGYMRLAEQAERNSQLDLTYETPPDQKELGGGARLGGAVSGSRNNLREACAPCERIPAYNVKGLGAGEPR